MAGRRKINSHSRGHSNPGLLLMVDRRRSAPKAARKWRRGRSKRPIKITIRDVARQTRLSLATISRALRNQPGIAESTRDRVKRVARRLGYVPNLAGAALSTGRMHSVVYVLPDVSAIVPGLLQIEVLKGLIDELARHSYNVTVFSEELLRKLHLTIFDVHRVLHADGVVLVIEHAEDIAPITSELTLPMVIVNRVLSTVSADFVIADDEKGGYLATSHLTKLGHKRIGHITSVQNNVGLVRRLRGYESALREAGLPIAPDLISREGLITSEGGFIATRRLIDSGAAFTGLFCSSDVLVPGVLRALRESGRRVPEDVSIVSFDDLPLAELVDPALTTVRKPRYDMGVEAGRLLMKRISGELEADPVTTVLQIRLIERQSSSSPGGGP
jgi:LacI family transcriptional regulator